MRRHLAARRFPSRDRCAPAVIGALSGVYHLSRRQTQGVLADLFGIELSTGAISEGEAEIGDATAGIVAQAHAHVQVAPVMHADETGHKECGALHWMWLVATQCLAVFLAAARRSAGNCAGLICCVTSRNSPSAAARPAASATN